MQWLLGAFVLLVLELLQRLFAALLAASLWRRSSPGAG
jgi:hypothetical protein